MQPPAAPNRPRNHGETSAETVVLIGASIRSAAQSANRAGFRILGIDHFGDIDTRQACQEFWILNEFLKNPEVIRRFRSFPHFVVGGLNHGDDLAGFLTPPPTIVHTSPAKEPGSDSAVPLRNPDFDLWDDPHWLEKLSKECGLNFPNFFHSLIPDVSPPHTSHKRWLRKMEHSCGGLGVRWHKPSTSFTPACRDSQSAHDHPGPLGPKIEANADSSLVQMKDSTTMRQMFQEWVPGRPHGATLICNGEDCCLLGVCRSLFTHLSDLPFVYRGSFGPVPISHSLQERIHQLGLKITRETGHRGLLNIDLVINRSGKTFVLEVNPRWSGSSELIERWMQNRTQIGSLFGAMVEACNGAPMPDFKPNHGRRSTSVGCPWSEGPQYLKRIIFARQAFQFSQDILAFSTEPSNESRFQSTFFDLPADGTWISAGQPICTLVSQIPRGTPTNSFGLDKEKGPMHQHRTFLRRLFESAHS